MSNKYKGIPPGISRLAFSQYLEEKDYKQIKHKLKYEKGKNNNRYLHKK